MKKLFYLLVVLSLASVGYSQTKDKSDLNIKNSNNKIESKIGEPIKIVSKLTLVPDFLSYFDSAIEKFNIKDYYGAIDYYTKTIEVNPNFKSAYFNRAISRSNIQNHQGAIEDLTKLIQISPSFLLFYIRASEKYKLQNFMGAIDDYLEAKKFADHDFQIAAIFFEMGNTKYAIKDYSGAIDDYDAAIKIFPDPEKYKARGMAKKNIKNKIGAKSDFTKAAKIEKDLERKGTITMSSLTGYSKPRLIIIQMDATGHIIGGTEGYQMFLKKY